MKEINIDITSAGFPSQFVTDSEKETDDFWITNRTGYSI